MGSWRLLKVPCKTLSSSCWLCAGWLSLLLRLPRKSRNHRLCAGWLDLLLWLLWLAPFETRSCRHCAGWLGLLLWLLIPCEALGRLSLLRLELKARGCSALRHPVHALLAAPGSHLADLVGGEIAGRLVEAAGGTLQLLLPLLLWRAAEPRLAERRRCRSERRRVRDTPTVRGHRSRGLLPLPLLVEPWCGTRAPNPVVVLALSVCVCALLVLGGPRRGRLPGNAIPGDQTRALVHRPSASGASDRFEVATRRAGRIEKPRTFIRCVGGAR